MYKMKDRSAGEAWEVYPRYNNKSLSKLMKTVIACDSRIVDTYRQWEQDAAVLKGREVVVVLVEIPRDSVSKFKELWDEEMEKWTAPSVC